jgi:hypothetical protein
MKNPGVVVTRALRTSACLASLLLVACGTGAHEENGVRAVEAKIEGLTCPACVLPLTTSLKQSFDQAAAVLVDDGIGTALVRFDSRQQFSVARFQEAVERVDMKILGFRIQACGRVDAADGERRLTAGSNRFLLKSDEEIPLNTPLCVMGVLKHAQEPLVIEVVSFELQQRPRAS